MQKYEYLIKPEIATIESNKDLIPKFSLGSNLDLYSGPYSSKIKISFNVRKDLLLQNGAQKFNYFYGGEGKDEVSYTKPTGMGIKIKLHLKSLFNDTRVIVNDAYYKFVRIRADNVYPTGVHLTDILLVNLLQRKYTPLHCAAISSRNEGTLIVAPADTGKI